MLGLCALGPVLGGVQNRARANGRVDPLTQTIRGAVDPLAPPLIAASNASGGFFHGLVHARGLSEENARLRAEMATVALYQEQIGRLEREIRSLRKVTGYGEFSGKTKVAADVVGFAAYENRITLSVGRNQGVRPGMPVVAAEGLLGVVQTVASERCDALLLTSVGLKIGAVDMTRNPAPAGLLKGEKSSTLSLEFQDPKAPVEIGDTIVTAGFSERIPRGIPIGKVIQVQNDEAFGILRALVDPNASIGDVREVFVLR